MKAGAKRNLKILAYGLGAVFLTLYFMFLTFPFEAVQDRLIASVAGLIRLPIQVKEIRSTPLLWIRLSDVRLLEGPGAEAQAPLKIDEAKIRPSLPALALGRVSLRVKANLWGGRLSAKLGQRKGERTVKLSWKGLRLESLGPMVGLKEAKLAGAFSGSLNLAMQGENWATGRGNLSARLTEGSSRNLSVAGFPTPELKDIRGSLDLRVEQKKAFLDGLALESPSLQLFVEGTADLLPRLSSSRLDLKGRLKLGEDLAQTYQPMVSGLLRNRDDQGFYTFSLKGTPTNPKFVP